MLHKVKGKLLAVFILLMMISFHQALAQNNLGDIIQGESQEALEDANKLAEGYADPFMNGFGNGIGSGWYNTAKAHKSLGFDIGFTVGLAYIPDDEMFYDPNSLNLNSITLNDAEAPTMFGPDREPSYTYDPDPNIPGDEQNFNGPPGLGLKDDIGFNAAPVVIPQVGIGIYKNTDLKIRWLPEVKLGDDGRLNLFGVAVMHDIKQHIPGLKMSPFDWSVLVGFTNVKTTLDLEDDTSVDNRGLFDTNTWTFQTIVSKKLSVLTFYGALGYNAVKSDLKLEGEYEYDSTNGDTIIDPISLSAKSNGMRFTAGMRLKLGVFSLHSDYTFQKYNTLSVGLGFAFR